MNKSAKETRQKCRRRKPCSEGHKFEEIVGMSNVLECHRCGAQQILTVLSTSCIYDTNTFESIPSHSRLWID